MHAYFSTSLYYWWEFGNDLVILFELCRAYTWYKFSGGKYDLRPKGKKMSVRLKYPVNLNKYHMCLVYICMRSSYIITFQFLYSVTCNQLEWSYVGTKCAEFLRENQRCTTNPKEVSNSHMWSFVISDANTLVTCKYMVT